MNAETLKEASRDIAKIEERVNRGEKLGKDDAILYFTYKLFSYVDALGSNLTERFNVSLVSVKEELIEFEKKSVDEIKASVKGFEDGARNFIKLFEQSLTKLGEAIKAFNDRSETLIKRIDTLEKDANRKIENLRSYEEKILDFSKRLQAVEEREKGAQQLISEAVAARRNL
ncbi:MAG: hypothetical protein QXU62_02320, partial [Thermofilaceae archaeon]